MPKSYVTIGGVDFPAGTPTFYGHLNIARFGFSKKYWKRTLGEYKTSRELGFLDPGEAMILAIRELFPRHVFDVNPWAERMLLSLTNESETVLIGCSGAGKSQVVGLWCLLWWALAPKTTTIYLASTSVPGLKKRSWASVAQYFAFLKECKFGYPGVHNRQMTAILNESDTREGVQADSVRSGLFGIAVEAGNEIEVSGRIAGVHQATLPGADNYGEGGVALFADELQVMAGGNAFFRAVVNMKQGCDVFRLGSAGNIYFRASSNQLAARADPEYGWSSIYIDSTESWRSKRGANVLRFDAYKSPGLSDPERYSYLPTRESIAEQLAECYGNENSPDFMAMSRAYPSDTAESGIVFPMNLQDKYKVREQVRWMNDRPEYLVWGLDPAFTEGGDSAKLAIGGVGVFSDGVVGVGIIDVVRLPIDAMSATPVTYQLEQAFSLHRATHKFELNHGCADSTGTQTVADTLEVEAGEFGIIRVSFSGRATEGPVSLLNSKKCYEEYANLRTEMWYRIVEFARFGQIRGLPDAASAEFATRLLLPGKVKKCIEPKEAYKKRSGARSPDDADAVCLMLKAACEHGLVPGATIHHRNGRTFNTRNTAKRSVDYDESDFLVPESY